MTLEEAAVAAGVSVRTLARYRKSGALDVVRVGRRVLCTLGAIERALVKRSVQQIGAECLAAGIEHRPLAEWFPLLQELAAANPAFEQPQRQRAHAEEALARLRGGTVRDYRVAEYRAVHNAISAAHPGSTLAPVILAFPEETPVVDVFRLLHSQFNW